MFDPSILKCDPTEKIVMIDPSSKQRTEVSASELTALGKEYGELFSYLEDLDNHVFTLSETEYLNKPAILWDYRNQFKAAKNEFLSEQQRHGRRS